jgi:hypothetical protein
VWVSSNLGKQQGVKRLGKEAPRAASLQKKMNSHLQNVVVLDT